MLNLNSPISNRHGTQSLYVWVDIQLFESKPGLIFLLRGKIQTFLQPNQLYLVKLTADISKIKAIGILSEVIDTKQTAFDRKHLSMYLPFLYAVFLSMKYHFNPSF